MPSDPKARAEAFDLLLPVDPRHSLVTVGEALLDAAAERHTSGLVTEAFESVSAWMSDEKRPLVYADQMAVWDDMRRREGRFGFANEAEFVEPILLAVYLRAKAALSGATGKPFLGDFENNLKKVKPALDKNVSWNPR